MFKLSTLLKLTLVLAFAGLLQACNTTEGVGKDVKGAGAGIENAADRNK